MRSTRFRRFRRVVREYDDVVLLVDSASGVGGAEVLTDEWKLDFVLTGSQKALALPPGLAFAAASERLMKRAAVASRKGVYFDLTAFWKHICNLQTPNTPAVSLLYALSEQLSRIASEGIVDRWARHRRMAERCAEWVAQMREERGTPLTILAAEGQRSPTVTCVVLPDGGGGTTCRFRHERAGLRHRSGIRQAEAHDVPGWPHGRSHG